ncbi:MAG: phage holin family protein [Candidatus Woesebacteria bacterium]|jgi:putative membrane protein
MKKIIRHFLIDLLALYFVTQIASGMVFERGIQTMLITAGAMTVVTILAKPVINLLLLPLNLVTFGVFKWVSSAVALYIVTLIVDNFKIAYFDYAGFTSKWIDIPHLHFEKAAAFIGFAFLLSIITSFIRWARK